MKPKSGKMGRASGSDWLKKLWKQVSKSKNRSSVKVGELLPLNKLWELSAGIYFRLFNMEMVIRIEGPELPTNFDWESLGAGTLLEADVLIIGPTKKLLKDFDYSNPLWARAVLDKLSTWVPSKGTTLELVTVDSHFKMRFSRDSWLLELAPDLQCVEKLKEAGEWVRWRFEKTGYMECDGPGDAQALAQTIRSIWGFQNDMSVVTVRNMICCCWNHSDDSPTGSQLDDWHQEVLNILLGQMYGDQPSSLSEMRFGSTPIYRVLSPKVVDTVVRAAVQNLSPGGPYDVMVPEDVVQNDSFWLVDYTAGTILQGQLLSGDFQIDKSISKPEILNQFSPSENVEPVVDPVLDSEPQPAHEEAGLHTLRWEAAEAAWLGRWRTSCFSQALNISYLSSDEEDIDPDHELPSRVKKVVDLWLSGVKNDSPDAAQERALALINRKPAAIEKSAYRAIKAYLQEDFLEVDCDSSVRRAITLKAIPQLIELRAINVFRKTEDDSSLISFALDCSWDEEHGCEVLFQGAEALEVGALGEFNPDGR